MQEITSLMQNGNFLVILLGVNLIILIGLIINTIRISKIKKENKELIVKLGGTDIKEDLKGYIHRVEAVEQKTDTIINYCKNLENTLTGCIQKIGIIRYSAFRDTGSDLSFALALLDDKNNGVILNGIYSREMSNIYAKPVVDGEATYTLSEEEKQALQKAINYKGEPLNEN